MNVLTRRAAATRTQTSDAGRNCPRDYAYPPSVFAQVPDFSAETLYVVGGLYGNLAALDAIETLASREEVAPHIVFNGDFHWFDAESDWFVEIERRVARHAALRGNVETELARAQDIGAGCGCAYPETVDEGVVQRSNEILAQLRAEMPWAARTRLSALPMHLVAQVGRLRIGIVHGDACSLAGWRFAQEALDDAANKRWLQAVRAESYVDVFACTHTCLAALRDFDLQAGGLTIVNNGAAGMPNFAGSGCGVVTRIATSPSRHEPLYGLRRDGVHIDALPLDYDHDAFVARFLERWPPGSSAYESYYRRIVDGPEYTLEEAGPR